MILVIKLGGKVVDCRQGRDAISGQIAELNRRGHRLVIVHGGGKQLNNLSRRLGTPIVQHEGRRVTDETTLKLAIMVFSLINRKLVASLISSGLSVIGISAFDGQLTACSKRPPIPIRVVDSVGCERVQEVDFGLVGDIQATNPAFVLRLWDEKMVPVVSCLGTDAQGQILNINADTLASELAIGLTAERLLFVSDIRGLYLKADDSDSLIPELNESQAQKYLNEGRFTDGMVPKMQTALKALRQGVACVQILSGLEKDALLQGLDGKTGTVVRAEGSLE